MQRFLSKNYKFIIFLCVSTFIYGILVVSTNYFHIPYENILTFLPYFFHGLFITACSGIIIYLLALNRWVFAIFFPVFFIVTGIIAYYIHQYDITINSAVIDSFLHTNLFEIKDQISTYLLLYFLVLIIAVVFIVRARFKIKLTGNLLIHLMVIMCGFLIIYSVNRIRFNTIYQRNPFLIYLGLKNYFLEKKELKKNRNDISHSSHCMVDSLTVVFVIGEALRADHVCLNGYARETFPLTKTEKEFISFPNIYSQWTHTIKSIPHILTRADSLNPDLAYKEKSFISIFKACGFRTYWIGNQDLNKAFKSFAYEADSIHINRPFRSDYNFTSKYDEELLPILDKALQNSQPRKLIIIHLIGCHWWYPSYYPRNFEVFIPSIKSKSFTSKDRQKIINAYDNAVLYTDYVLYQIIQRIKHQRSIMIFLADHGEALGENNKWLHAQDTKYEKNPACFVWFSDSYKFLFPYKLKAVKKNKNNCYRTDFLFHSILDAAEIRSPFLNHEYNIFYSQN